jgi:hypothetical protein
MVLTPKYIESTTRSFAPGDQVSISWEPQAALVLGEE